MTVSSQVNRKDYAGNGSTTAFATEFRFLAETSIKVIVTVNSTSVETVQTLTTDYTVSGVGDDSGGTVTMIVPPATGETLTIKRDGPLTQNTDYVENDDFPAESHEQALDKLTMNMQQQQEELDRSIKLSEGQQSLGLTIPAPDTGKFLQWDALGNFINVDIANQGLLIVTAFGQSLISAIDAAAGRLIMGSAKKASSAVTNNIAVFDSDDEAKDSGVPFVRTGNAAGAADVITVAFAIPVTVITDKLETRVRALSNNATTTPTINYDGLGANTIVKNGNQPLAIDDIQVGQELILVSNTANDNVELLNPASSSAISLATPVAASGTSVDFTGLPTGIKSLTFNFIDVSTNGSSNIVLQLGTSSGIETAGYFSQTQDALAGFFRPTDGLGVTVAVAAGSVFGGSYIISLASESANSWAGVGSLNRSDNHLPFSAGNKTLADVLDRVRFTTANGTDIFDAGTINISWSV